MAESALRRIAPLTLPTEAVRATDFGALPEPIWAAPTDLWVDEGYQRDLTRRSLSLILRIVAGFAWRNVKPPIVVPIDSKHGSYEVIDGQHTAIAAATLAIPKMLVVRVDARSDVDKARSFVAHNRERLVMSPFDIYRGEVAAKEPLALAVRDALDKAGCRLRLLNKFVQYKAGDTAAIGVIRALVHKRGAPGAARVLGALVAGGRAPISAAEIGAVEAVLYRPEAMGATELGAVIRHMGVDGVVRAESIAKTERVAAKVVLAREYVRVAGVLRRRTEKERKTA